MSPDYVPNYERCRLPYVQWYQDEFIGGVRGMKAQEIGIYTMLLMEMYIRGRPLDQSHDRLARMCGADRRSFDKTLNQLIEDGKIIKLNCGYWNERCENVFRSRAKMQQQNSDAAHKSWENRKEINGEEEHPHSDCNADAMPSSEAQILIEEPKGSPSSRPVGAKVNEARSQKKAIEAEFSETFWPAYPRKVEKQDALKAFLKARATAPLETIVAGLRAFAAEMVGKDPQFIRHASKWLNSASWENSTGASSAVSIVVDDDQWVKRLKFGRAKQSWDSQNWGPMPRSPGCVVPESLLQPEDGAGWREWEQAA